MGTGLALGHGRMSSDEIKIGCLVFLIIMAIGEKLPAGVVARFPKLRGCINIVGCVVITVVAFFATTGK